MIFVSDKHVSLRMNCNNSGNPQNVMMAEYLSTKTQTLLCVLSANRKCQKMSAC